MPDRRRALLKEKLAELRIDFPVSYTRFLLSHRGRDRYARPAEPGLPWSFATLEESDWDSDYFLTLDKQLDIDGESVLFVRQLQVIAKTIADALQIRSLRCPDGTIYPLQRMAKGLAIATVDGNVLFLDPMDAVCKFSVWAFYVSSNEVERHEWKFADWKRKATPETS